MRRHPHLAFAAVALLGWIGGCSQGKESAGPPPPPPPPSDKPAPTFSYPHTVKTPRQRKLVVAFVRVDTDEDKPIDDVPYGGYVRPDSSDARVTSEDAQAVHARRAAEVRLRHVLKRSLLDSGQFVVVERDRILDVLRELHFGKTQYVDAATATDMGEIMSVQYLLEVSIGPNEDEGYKGTVDPVPGYAERTPTALERVLDPDRTGPGDRARELREARFTMARRQAMRREYPYGAYLSLYSVRTSEVVAQSYGIGANRMDALNDAVEELIDLATDIQAPPCIAHIANDRIFLDFGSADGAKPGQTVRYRSSGEVIRNPSGQVIGRDERDGGTLEIVEVQTHMSIARIVDRRVEPAVGDRVPLE